MAHVKWFCAYDIAGQPVGLENVLCLDFEFLTFTAVAVLLLACLFDRSAAGAALARSFDRATSFLAINSEIIIRASLSFYLTALWAIGGILLTPELTSASPILPWLQLVMAACLLWRGTLQVTGFAVALLFLTATVRYGVFHLLDYPIFLGVAAYLVMTGRDWRPWNVRAIDVLRWSISITLMWASIEKWAYPEWSYPLFITHPAMAMGFEPAFFMKSAGVVEFTLAFALLLPSLIRRCAALALTTIFVAAIFSFGPIDAIGHAPIIGVLVAIIGDRARDTPRARDVMLVPLHYGGALAVFLGLYYLAHTMFFGTTLT